MLLALIAHADHTNVPLKPGRGSDGKPQTGLCKSPRQGREERTNESSLASGLAGLAGLEHPRGDEGHASGGGGGRGRLADRPRAAQHLFARAGTKREALRMALDTPQGQACGRVSWNGPRPHRLPGCVDDVPPARFSANCVRSGSAAKRSCGVAASVRPAAHASCTSAASPRSWAKRGRGAGGPAAGG